MSDRRFTLAFALILTFALVAPLALPAAAAHVAPWQARGAYWLPAPADSDAHGFALRLETVEKGDTFYGPLMADHGSVSVSPADGLRADGLGALSFDFFLESGTCGAGAPRMMLRIDADGDDTFRPASSSDFYLGVYPDQVLAKSCPTGAWVTYDLLDDGAATWFPGGDASNAIASLVANHPNHEIHRVDLQFDNTVTNTAGPAVVWLDNIAVHDHTLAEPAGGEVTCPQLSAPPANAFVPCPFVVG